MTVGFRRSSAIQTTMIPAIAIPSGTARSSSADPEEPGDGSPGVGPL
jgi:hypothetical protein